MNDSGLREPREQDGLIQYAPVDIISSKSISPADFEDNYVKPGIPCIFDDLVEDWPAYRKWSRSYFANELGDTPIFFHHVKKDSPARDHGKWISRTTLSDFLERIDAGEPIKHFGSSTPAYDFVATHPTLLSDIHLSTIERVLPDTRFFGLGRMDSRCWPWIPPYPLQMFIAGKGRRSPGHYDPNSDHTFHWCVWGCKKLKLFTNDPRHKDTLEAIREADLWNPLEPEVVDRLPRDEPLQGWSTLLSAGQTVFIPSRVWHFFDYAETSLSLVFRSRSFDSLEGYCDFAADVQSPSNMVPYYSKMWREVDRSQRSVVGNLLAICGRPVLIATRLGLVFVKFCLSVKLGLQWARSVLLPGRDLVDG